MVYVMHVTADTAAMRAVRLNHSVQSHAQFLVNKTHVRPRMQMQPAVHTVQILQQVRNHKMGHVMQRSWHVQSQLQSVILGIY